MKITTQILVLEIVFHLIMAVMIFSIYVHTLV